MWHDFVDRVRRGAMMATLRCDHPDIEEFVKAKQQPGQLRRFNVSVQVTDAFMAAVRSDADWSLLFPAAAVDSGGQTVVREWPGSEGSVPCSVLRHMRARHLWDLILRGTYDYAEPGVLFVDRINKVKTSGTASTLAPQTLAVKFHCRLMEPAISVHSILPASLYRHSRLKRGSTTSD